jgi:hypothetical protein
MEFAYIAQGRLFVGSGQAPARPVDSPFAQEYTARAVALARKNEWKTQRREGMWENMNLWNAGGGIDTRAIRINFMDVTRGPGDGEMLYCMATDRVSGLFRQAIATGEEARLIHHDRFRLHQIRRQPGGNRLVGSCDNGNGTASLVLVEGDNYRQHDLTGGDSRDQNPAWIPGQEQAIVYESAGAARNQAGFAVGHGPSAPMRLDLASRVLETVLEHPGFDYLQPRFAADGTLYYIRRPYQLHAVRPVDPGKALLDVVLFPFRLARALIDYLNYFSMVYSRKPLKTAGGPARPEEDMANIMLQGRRLAVKRELEQFSADGTPALVPRDWELVRHARDGMVSVLSKGCSGFDLTDGGEIIYTNGTGIFAMAADGGNRRQLGRAWLVERVCAL